MKIAYVNYTTNLVGVYKKIIYQRKAVEKLGLNIDFFLMSGEKPSILTPENGIKFIQLPPKYHPVKKIVEHFNNNYDLIIWRANAFTPSSFYYFHNKSFKLISEHHSKELPYYLNRVSEQPQKMLKTILLELFTAQLHFSLVDGIICLTNEIEEYQNRRGFRYPEYSITIANGIDVESVSFTKFKPFDGKTLQMVLIASEKANWHGIDRILKGVDKYQGDLNIKLHVVGGYLSKKELPINIKNESRIKIYGYLYADDLDNLMKEMNLAIGSLAAHRNGLKQACALKVRDYTARGIPFILSYDDVDIKNDCPFCLKLPDNDEPIEVDILVDFCEKLARNYSTSEISHQMRVYANHYLDWQPKMQAYSDFARQVYNRQ